MIMSGRPNTKPQTASKLSLSSLESETDNNVSRIDSETWNQIGTARQASYDREALKTSCGALARKARDAFTAACLGETVDDIDTQYESAVAALTELWPFAVYRDRPFRDLLGLLEASLRYRAIAEFNQDQRDAIKAAFTDLVHWHVDQSQYDQLLERFVESDIDIEAPLRAMNGKTVRVVIEIADDERESKDSVS